MFIVSQYLLNLTGLCTTYQQLLSYSIALGLILYSSIYLYLLFYNNDFLPMFNSFIFYIIIVDLVLSTYYYFKLPEMKNVVCDTESETSSNSDDEMEYISDNDVDEEDLDDEDLDEESKNYINNLIEKAKISDQQKMSEVLNKDEMELEPEPKIEEDIIESKEVQEESVIENHTALSDDNTSQDIDNIINDIVNKKPTKRAPKKKNIANVQIV